METLTVILQCISVSGTIMLAVVGYIFTKRQFKSTNFVSITTKHRLTKMIQLQEICRDVLLNSDVDYIDIVSDRTTVVQNFSSALSYLRANMHLGFKPDRDLIIQCEAIKKYMLEYIKAVNNTEYKAEMARKLGKERSSFAKLCDLYCATEWQRIKEETSGIESKFDNWSSKYEKNQEYYDNVMAEYNERIDNL